MNMEAALHALGVRDDTLTEAERARLDTDGFLPLPGILTPQQIAAITSQLAALLDDEGEQAGRLPHEEAQNGTQYVSVVGSGWRTSRSFMWMGHDISCLYSGFDGMPCRINVRHGRTRRRMKKGRSKG